MPSISSIRERMVTAAQAVVGLDSLRSPDDYRDLVAAGEAPAVAASMARDSGCALVVRGLLRRVGLVDARLEAPYVNGTAVSLLVAMANEADAWRPAWLIGGGDYVASEGDVFVLEGPEHVATIVHVTVDLNPRDPLIARPPVTTWHSVDGGQRGTYNSECVLSHMRELATWPVVARGHAALEGRPLLGVIDVVTLALRFGGAS